MPELYFFTNRPLGTSSRVLTGALVKKPLALRMDGTNVMAQSFKSIFGQTSRTAKNWFQGLRSPGVMHQPGLEVLFDLGRVARRGCRAVAQDNRGP